MRDEKQVRDQGKAHPNITTLHEGWVSARKGEDRDVNQSMAWLEGFDLWHWHHGSPAPGQQ